MRDGDKGKKAKATSDDAGGKSVSDSDQSQSVQKGQEAASRKRQTLTELLQIDLVRQHVFTACSPATLLRLSLSSCELRAVVAEQTVYSPSALPPQQACVGLRKGLSSLLRRAILESSKKLPLVGILEEHNETFLSEVVAVRGLLISASIRDAAFSYREVFVCGDLIVYDPYLK